MTKVRVALVGAGYIADYHARGLQQCPEVEIVTVVSARVESAQAFALKYNIPNSGTDILDLRDRKDIGGVVISTPNKFHAPYAIELLSDGKDVFLEKPMAMSTNEAEEIAKIAEKNNRLVMVGHMWRFDTEVNYIKDVIASGKLGKIIKTKGYGIHENWGPEGWFTKKDLAGGGALADMGVHAIDTVRYLIGDPVPEEVYAKIGTYYGDYEVDDSGIIVITWGNGVTSIIESGWWQPHMDGPEAATRLFGTKGYASVFPTYLKVEMEGLPGKFDVPMPDKKEHCDQIIYDRQMRYFVDCIKTRTSPSPGQDEGVIIQKIVDAAYLSAQEGRVIKL